jgi:D-threonate/D-erythronate kinase
VDPLQSQFGQRVHRFSRPALKRGPAPLAGQIQTALFRGYSVQVFDAHEDDDLKTLVMAGCRLENRVLWTGSAGLARYLPLGWGCSVKAAVQDPRREPGPVLVINGSLNPVNAEQLGALEKNRSAQVFWIEDEDSENSRDTQVKLGNLCRSMETGADAALSVRLTRPIRSAAQLQQLQDTLQFAALQCVKSQTPAGMVLVGGDTAMKLYRRVGAKALRILGEVQPGISYGSWVGGVLDGQYVVTKAGGFGEPGTLVKAVEFLRGK